jgi:NADPH-dependent glutamate synthase beta subunit-like oxidoreductase
MGGYLLPTGLHFTTGIPSVFAAGDGVSGPATIIEAVAQAKVAALSCHQFLSGLPVVALKMNSQP